MNQEFLFFINTTIALFVIVDPFAVVPVYLILTERFSALERRHIRRKASLISAAILLAFALTGLGIFNIFGITLPAFQIAGGLLLLQLGIAQLNAKDHRVKKEETDEGLERDDISIFPLATPLIAGPGSISTVVLYAAEATTIPRRLSLLVSVILVITACYATLKVAPLMFRLLGRTGLNLLTRIMGIILAAVAVQFILNGIRGSLVLMQIISN